MGIFIMIAKNHISSFMVYLLVCIIAVRLYAVMIILFKCRSGLKLYHEISFRLWNRFWFESVMIHFNRKVFFFKLSGNNQKEYEMDKLPLLKVSRDGVSSVGILNRYWGSSKNLKQLFKGKFLVEFIELNKSFLSSTWESPWKWKTFPSSCFMAFN